MKKGKAFEKRIRIGAYMPISHYDERHVRELAEAGVDFAVMEFKLMPRERITPELLSWFSKYGVDFTVDDPRANKTVGEGGTVLDFEKEDLLFYKDEPGYISYSFVDEPGMRLFEALGKEVAEFSRRYPNQFAFINLLPMYANQQQLLGGAWAAPIEYYGSDINLYRMYLQEYVKHVDTHYICIDVYPCKARPHPDHPDRFPLYYEKYTYSEYVKNLEYGANAARNSGRELWICLQSCSWHRSMRPVDNADLRWQAYTCLSYGTTNFLYYVFAARIHHDYAMIDFRGEKTQLYYDSQKLALGLKKLSPVFVQYRNLGAFNLNSTPETTPYLEMNTPYTEFTVLEELSCDTPLLVGCFEKEKGEGHAFTLVNMQDFADPKTATVRFCAEGRLTLYRDGEPTVLESRDGCYEIGLDQGDGVFVTIE